MFRSVARLGEVVDQNRLERQVDQPPLPLDSRILEVLPAGACVPRVGDQPGDVAVPINQLQGKRVHSASLQATRCLGSSNRPAASSDQLFAISAPMASVVAAYTATDPVELLVIAHNLRTDRCTDHQWQRNFFFAGAYGAIA